MKKQVRKYNTSADYVYAELRRQIFTKQIVPGARLPEIKVAEQIKVSRSPVREALKRLANEGLVKITPNSGARVTKPTAAEVQCAYAVREHLEIMSVSEAAKNGLNKRAMSKMEQTIAGEKRAFAKKNIARLIDTNNMFHRLLADASKNPILSEHVRMIHLRTCVYILYSNPLGEQFFSCIEQHSDILRAVSERDEFTAESLMRDHLRRVRSMFTIPEEQPVPKK